MCLIKSQRFRVIGFNDGTFRVDDHIRRDYTFVSGHYATRLRDLFDKIELSEGWPYEAALDEIATDMTTQDAALRRMQVWTPFS